jgi:hypothetical protein
MEKARAAQRDRASLLPGTGQQINQVLPCMPFPVIEEGLQPHSFPALCPYTWPHLLRQQRVDINLIFRFMKVMPILRAICLATGVYGDTALRCLVRRLLRHYVSHHAIWRHTEA